MLVEFAIYPMDGTHMSRDVAKVIEILEEAGVDYRLGPTSTAVEGEWEAVVSAIHRCHQAAIQSHPRVITTIAIDDRKDQTHHLEPAA